MRPESLKYLYDVMQATGIIAKVCSTITYAHFAEDVVIRSAVERQFEIAGEALSQLGKIDSGTFDRVPHAPQIVAFRNFLIHRYAHVNSLLVWGIVQNDLGNLQAVTGKLLDEGEAA